MKNTTELKRIKATLKCLIEQYGGKTFLSNFLITQIQEDLQWYFRNITNSQLTFARNYMNSLKSKNK